MTEEEIVRKYQRTAADNTQEQRLQITILADLNACSKKDIKTILQNHGCEVPPALKRRPKKKEETTAQEPTPAESKEEENPFEGKIWRKKQDAAPEIPMAVFTACMKEAEVLKDAIKKYNNLLQEVRSQRDEAVKSLQEIRDFIRDDEAEEEEENNNGLDF
jgi:hypothetical protein